MFLKRKTLFGLLGYVWIGYYGGERKGGGYNIDVFLLFEKLKIGGEDNRVLAPSQVQDTLN